MFVSGIVSRRRDDTIGCYIRIPEEYSYDGWKIDFKTGEVRIVDYSPAEGDDTDNLTTDEDRQQTDLL